MRDPRTQILYSQKEKYNCNYCCTDFQLLTRYRDPGRSYKGVQLVNTETNCPGSDSALAAMKQLSIFHMVRTSTHCRALPSLHVKR